MLLVICKCHSNNSAMWSIRCCRDTYEAVRILLVESTRLNDHSMGCLLTRNEICLIKMSSVDWITFTAVVSAAAAGAGGGDQLPSEPLDMAMRSATAAAMGMASALKRLRALIKAQPEGISAYIVPHDDAHLVSNPAFTLTNLWTLLTRRQIYPSDRKYKWKTSLNGQITRCLGVGHRSFLHHHWATAGKCVAKEMSFLIIEGRITKQRKQLPFSFTG